MIRDLSIANLGVIGSTRLEFAEGLTVLSGETGAGKTLITTALSLLLGAKGDATLIRFGASEATIDCTLAVSDDIELIEQLDSLGAVTEHGEVIVTRTLGTRSRATLGSRPVAAAVLESVLGERITVHGQHGQVRLTRSSEQRALLDDTIPEIGELLPVVRQSWQNLRDARDALDVAKSSSTQDLQRIAGLRALVDDVDTVNPQAGEDEALDARIASLSALDAIERATRTASAMLVDGDTIDITDASSLLAQVKRLLEPHASAAEFASWIGRIQETQDALSEVAHEVTAYVDALEGDASSLDDLLSRRAQIGALLRRWGCDLPTLLARYAEAARAVALANDPESQLRELEQLVNHCTIELEQVCAHLHGARLRAAGDLGRRVATELHELGLPHAVFEISVDRQSNPTSHGDDVVEFRFSANPGQPPQALATVGSGGELSRVMLALEAVAAHGPTRTFVFDEVDAGVGGKAALEVGRRLSRLARHGQVVVVTHLAQVAAFADRHIVVEKTVQGETTLTTARQLTDAERPRELTRLLSGVEDSASAMAHASELLDLARVSRADAS